MVQTADVNWTTLDLDELLAAIWSSLTTASREPAGPFRTAALATVSAAGPAVRTVVLRDADRTVRALTCFTDVRSAKVAEIRLQPRVQWLFYDPTARVQFRMSGEATVRHDDPESHAAWKSLPPVARREYAAAQAPGSPLAASPPDAEAPATLDSPEPFGDENHCRVHFAVLRAAIDEIDWLRLDPTSHRRARFKWTGANFAGAWLTP